MYEVDFTGWTRTPEDLKELKTNKKYRRRLNWTRLCKSIKYKRGLRSSWEFLGDWVFNRSHF